MKPTEQEIQEAADKYVFEEADHNRKWSNNDDTAGDNFGSFKSGAKWAISQMQPEWVSVSSSDDIPKDNEYYWVEDHFGEITLDRGYTMYVRSTKRYTPIVKPQPPTK